MSNMKKQLLENAINMPIVLNLKSDEMKTLAGYLVRDEHNPKRYKILPLDISKDVIVFPASYVEYYRFLNNGHLVK